MRGWRVKSSEFPFSYRAEKQGFVVESSDGRNFIVRDPKGEEVGACGTSLEAHRLAEASINRATPLVHPTREMR